MQTLYTILYVLVTVVLLGGLFSSLRYRARQKTEMDHGIDPSIRNNPIYRNPVFWAFILFAAVAFGLIWIYKLYYRAPF